MEDKLKFIVRIESTDLEGSKPILHSLRKVKGVSHSMANAICVALKLDKTKQTGLLTETEIKDIGETLKGNAHKDIPSWLLNRQKDFDSGEDLHLTSSTLKLRKDFDIKRLRKIKTYIGTRHGLGLPVRGQRTKSNFRRGKVIGVKKKKK